MPVLSRLRMPWRSGGDSHPPTDEPWYSYEFGPIHFTVLSSEQHLYGTQKDWLENDLKNVNRTATPWVIVASHRPMWISSDWGGTKPEFLSKFKTT